MTARPSLMRPRWSKVFADLRADPLRTFLVVASIAVGAFAVGAIASAFFVLFQDANRSFASAHPANIVIWTNGFDDSFLSSLERLPAVAEAEGRVDLSVNAVEEGEPDQPLSLVALKDYSGSQINLLEHRSGAKLPLEGEMLLGFDPLKFPGFGAGDELMIELPNGASRRLAVVGEVISQGVGADPWAPSVGYISFGTLDWLGVDYRYNRLLICVAGDGDDEAYIDSVAAEIEEKIEKSGRWVYRTDTVVSSTHPLEDILLAVLGVLGALGLMVVFLSVSLISNTLNALVAQGRRQIGVMKLIGGRSHQILAMYMVMILLFGLLALAIAVPAGAWAGYELAEFIAYMLNARLQGLRIIRPVVLIQALVTVLVPLVAGFVPVIRGARTTVHRALSSDQRSSGTQSSGVGSKVWALFSWMSRPVLLSLRNTFRQKRRLALTLLTLSVSGALFIGVFGVRDSLQAHQQKMVKYFMSDLMLSFEQPYRVSTVQQAALEVEGIELVESWGYWQGEMLDDKGEIVRYVMVSGVPQGSTLIEPILTEGRWLLPGDNRAIVISEAVKKQFPGIRPGNTLRMRLTGGQEEEWTMVGVISFPGFAADEPAYIPLESITGTGQPPAKGAHYRLVISHHGEAAQQRIGQALEQHLRERGFDLDRIQTGASMDRRIVQLLNILVRLLLIMSFLTAIVGSIGLTGTMGMNVLDRTREIGVMRAIGAVDSAIRQSVIIEGAFIGLISWVIAVPLSVPVGRGVLSIIAKAMNMGDVALTFAPAAMGLWLALVLVLTVLASVLPARNAARLTIRELLTYE